MSLKKLNHIHKFKRHKYKTGRLIYFCLNDCNFRIDCEFALGKISECNRCGKPFVMNKYATELDKPHCEECHRHRGEHSDKRKSARRKTDNPPKPLDIVSESLSEELVSSLKDRMSNLLMAKGESDTPKLFTSEGVEKAVDEIKSLTYKEFKLEDEEEFL